MILYLCRTEADLKGLEAEDNFFEALLFLTVSFDGRTYSGNFAVS
jgi:hypothetical protein